MLVQAASRLFTAVVSSRQDLYEERVGQAANRPTRFDRLRLEGVSFRYPGASRDALDDVSIDLEAGQVVALVGENGRVRRRWRNCSVGCTSRRRA